MFKPKTSPIGIYRYLHVCVLRVDPGRCTQNHWRSKIKILRFVCFIFLSFLPFPLNERARDAMNYESRPWRKRATIRKYERQHFPLNLRNWCNVAQSVAQRGATPS